jgi:hypothetical protein
MRPSPTSGSGSQRPEKTAGLPSTKAAGVRASFHFAMHLDHVCGQGRLSWASNLMAGHLAPARPRCHLPASHPPAAARAESSPACRAPPLPRTRPRRRRVAPRAGAGCRRSRSSGVTAAVVLQQQWCYGTVTAACNVYRMTGVHAVARGRSAAAVLCRGEVCRIQGLCALARLLHRVKLLPRGITSNPHRSLCVTMRGAGYNTNGCPRRRLPPGMNAPAGAAQQAAGLAAPLLAAAAGRGGRGRRRGRGGRRVVRARTLVACLRHGDSLPTVPS